MTGQALTANGSRRSDTGRRHGRAAALLGLLLVVPSAACTYLGFVREKRSLRRELAAAPSVALRRELAPEDCFVLTGELAAGPGRRSPVVVAALTRSDGKPEIVGAWTFGPEDRRYDLFLPEADYVLVAGADRNGDGFVDETEVGLAAGGEGVHVGPARAEDVFLVRGPAIDPSRVSASGPGGDVRFRIPVRPHRLVVPSLDDPLFAPELGARGLYRPMELLARTQGLVFALEPWDPDRTLVLFVHGAKGTPRDFRALVAGLDRKRHQAAFFYYPTGMPLRKVGLALAELLRAADGILDAGRIVVVAHSMGGLVSRFALGELCAKGRPARLAGYVSFATPYGGMPAARLGSELGPEPVPNWKDLTPGSPFLADLYASRLPGDLPFHLFFAWGNDEGRGPGAAGDGTVPLPSQLHPEIQAQATRLRGYGETHSGILGSPEAAKAFHAILAEMTAAPAPRRAKRGAAAGGK